MKLAFRTFTQSLVIVAFATATTAAQAGTEPAKPSPSTPQSSAPSKAEKCAQLKKKIADYEAAAAKGGKPAGSETIKQDIAWYKDNCK